MQAQTLNHQSQPQEIGNRGARRPILWLLSWFLDHIKGFWRTPGRFRLPLFLFSLAGAAVSAAFLSDIMSISSITKTQAIAPHREVIVAKSSLRPGDVLTKENLAVGRVPVEFFETAMLAPDRFSDVDGSVMTQPLSPGQALLSSHLAKNERRHPSLGLRRIQLVVEDRYGFKQLPLPGDFVDFFWQFPQGQSAGNANDQASSYLVEDVRLLSIKRANDTDNQNASRRAKGPWIHIEVEVLPEAALRLLRASSIGTLQMVLRNPDDRSLGPPQPKPNPVPSDNAFNHGGTHRGQPKSANSKLHNLEDPKPNAVALTKGPPPIKAPAGVEVIRGGQRILEPTPPISAEESRSSQTRSSNGIPLGAGAYGSGAAQALEEPNPSNQKSAELLENLRRLTIPSTAQSVIVQ